MNKKISTRLIITSITVLVALFWWQPWSGSQLKWQERELQLTPYQIEDVEAGDEYENPIKRSQFEFDRLKDPKTGQIPAQIKLKEQAFIHKQNAKIAPVNGNEDTELQPFSTSAASPFVNRGPWNIGGRTRALAIDVNNEDIILAGGISGGVWRTTNQGASWTRTSDLDQHPSVSALVQDRRAGMSNNWYYGTGERRGNSASGGGAFYFGNGIYKSTDNGASWSLIQSTAQAGTSGTDPINQLSTFTLIDEMAIDYSNTNQTEIYVAGTGRITRTDDDFQTFATVLGNNNNGNNMADVVVTPSGTVFATIGNQFANGGAGQDGVWRSDNGLSWTEITPASGLESSYLRLELAVDPQDESLIWLVSDQALMRWNDNTGQWTDLSAALEIPADPDDRDGFTDFTTQQYYDQLVTVHPNNSDVVYIGGTNLHRSLDGFSTTAQKRIVAGYFVENHHPDQHKVVFFDSDPNKMLTGDDGGVHLTSDNLADGSEEFPVTWQSLNNGYLSTQFYHADINNMDIGDPIIIGGMQDNGTFIILNTTDPQADWVRIGGGDGSWAGYTYNAFYHSSQNGFVDRREIVGNSIEAPIDITPLPESQREDEFLFINPFEYNMVNQDQVVIGGLGRAFFTNDVRTNPGVGEWFEITSPNITGSNANVTAMGFSVEPEGVLYMGTDFGDVLKVTNTQEINSSVQAEDLPIGNMPSENIGAIKVDPADADHVIVTFTNYGVLSIWESTDGGQTWSSISGNLEENPDGSGVGPSVRSFEIMPDGNGGNYYFAGTSVGLFMTQSLNGDNTVWTQQAPDVIGDVVVSWIRVRPIEGLVMVSTHANGTFTGTYDVGKNAFVNYSYNPDAVEYVLRANQSFDQNNPVGYQWIRNGEDIQGENSSTLTVTNGGVYQVRLNFIDGNTGASNAINIDLDGSAPEVTSITRFDPIDQDVQVSEVTFQVTFNEAVLNVDASDFESTGNATGSVAGVTEQTSNLVYNVTLNNIAGAGELGLTIVDGTDITDETGNLFSGRINASETYSIVDGVAPTASITRFDPSSETTNQAEVTFQIEFSEKIVGFGPSDLQFSTASVGATFGSLREVETGLTFEISVVEIEEDGLVAIEFSPSQDIEDESGNAFEGVVTTNESYTIENIITSIDERYLGGNGEIKVDRNPSDGLFYLAFPQNFAGDFDLGVINASGRIIKSEKVNGYQAEQQIALDLSTSPDGLYILKASKEDQELTIKLLKRSN